MLDYYVKAFGFQRDNYCNGAVDGFNGYSFACLDSIRAMVDLTARTGGRIVA